MVDLVNMFRQVSGYPVGEDTGPQYDWQRNRIASQGFSQIFDVIGNVGNQLTSAWAARDYADKVAAAKQRSYENAIALTNAQKESMLNYSAIIAAEKDKNAFMMESNAINLRTTAEQEHELNIGAGFSMTGAARTEYAASGVRTGTGSTASVMNNMTATADREATATYRSRINQIGSMLNSATQERLDARLTEWSAKERARFMTAETQIRLY